MKKNIYYALTIIVLFTFSCKSMLLTDDMKNTPTNCFKMLSKTVDENYSFFDYKHINWDSTCRYYKPMVNDKMPKDSLYGVLSGMLNSLNDGHVNMVTEFDRSRSWGWYQNYPQNFNFEFLQRTYLKNNTYYTGPLVNTWIDSIGYVHYGSFGSPIKTEHLNFVLDRFKNSKAIILDMRNNGGGSMANIFQIMSRFTTKKTYLGQMYRKNGIGHNDFSKGDSIFVKPIERKKDKNGKIKKIEKDAPDTLVTYLNKPIFILTNRLCYSATNFFVGYMKQLPNVTVIGDQTGGGGGLPISSELPNGWRYRFSATKMILPDGLNIEGGVPSNVQISTGPEDELKGIDAMIERVKLLMINEEMKK